jgi:hypothetical protein
MMSLKYVSFAVARSSSATAKQSAFHSGENYGLPFPKQPGFG